jgi:hypothetical protein
VQAYLDVEMIRGNGVAHATGFAGIPNGDVIRQGTVDLGSGPYVARAFLRYTLPLGGEGRDTLARAMDQVPTIVDARRLEISAGKLAATDYFDLNRYANTTRLQYMNWALFNNTAWDYAADTRGYTNGVTIAWIHPRWTVRVGSFQMPSEANGNQFDPDLRRARGDNAELTVLVPATATVVRLLGYVNHGRMGNYDNAVAIARANRATPDITADRQPGRSRSGVGWRDGRVRTPRVERRTQ